MTSRYLMARAFMKLLLHDAYMRRHTFADLHRHVRELPTLNVPYGQQVAREITNAVDIACAFYPRQVLCLQRSVVLVKLLRSYGVNAQMIIGAKRMPFSAHAWVEHNGAVINDRTVRRDQFLVLEIC
jgi:hypothetical protein